MLRSIIGALVLGAAACAPTAQTAAPPAPHRAAVAPAPAPTPAAADEASEIEEPPPTTAGLPHDVVVREVRIPGDKPVLVVPGDTPTPIVYLHGRCGDPTAFKAWADAGVRFGTILSLQGDQRCKASARTKWTEDAALLDRRITRALEVVSDELGIELDRERRVVVGYSQGALRAELLGTRYPDRYPRAVLIAGPRAPKPTSLTKSEAVLLVVGDHDARSHLSEAAQKLAHRGRAVRYLELPGARHGEYGADATRVFNEGLGWLTETPTAWRAGDDDAGSRVP